MNWKYSNIHQEHQLLDGGQTLARIQVKQKKKNFRVITLLSFIYVGTKRQEKLEKQKKEWFTHHKKLKDRKDVTAYIERKKEAVKKYITCREKEI